MRWVGSSTVDVCASPSSTALTSISAASNPILSFGRGTATFTCSTRLEDDQRVHIYGSKGRISIEIPFNIPSDRSARISISEGGNLPDDPRIETETFDPMDPYTSQADAFANSVLGRAESAIPLDDGVHNMTIIDSVFATA
jgi:predicted dehydrogenase